MMAETTRIAITKLNNNNYQIWKYKMELLLIKEDLWDVVSNAEPAEVSEDWQKRDNKARATIGLLVEDNQLLHVRNATTAKQAWDALKAYHEKSSLSSKVFLLKSIVNHKLQEGGDMEEQLNAILELADKLTALGERIVDSLLIAIILGSLPESYSTLVTALESRAEDTLTLALVKGKLIDEYKRRKNTRTDEAGEIAMKAAEKSGKTCYFCRKQGHYKRDCIKYKKWKSNKEKVGSVREDSSDEENEVVQCSFATCEGQVNQEDWYVDSGATSHMTNNKKFFQELKEINRSVMVANGQRLVAEGKGKGILKCVNKDGETTAVMVKDVLYIPSIAENLLSVRRLAIKGLTVNFDNSRCVIACGKREIAHAEPSMGMYKLQLKEIAMSMKSRHTLLCQHTWHRKFGHRSQEAIQQLSQGLATGITIKDCGIRATCECCIKGKMSRLPFPKSSESKSKAPLDLLHTDVCGPMQVKTPGGKRYALTVIDDYSRFTHVYLLETKSSTKIALRKYIDLVSNKFNRKPKVIRSDRGREYIDKVFTEQLEKDGIQVQLTAPYSPQQNGVAERKNRSLMNMVRCMLDDAKLPDTYWGEAISTANYLQNRLPTKATSNTPYELWEGTTPDVKHIHVFGCAAYTLVPKQLRKKLDSKAVKMTFMGYEPGSKAYRLLNQNTGKIIVSRDVQFIDEEIWSEQFTEVKFVEDSITNDLPKLSGGQEEQQGTSKQETSSVKYDGLDEKTLDRSKNIQQEERSTTSGQRKNSETEKVIEIIDSEDEAIDEAKTVRRSERNNKGQPPERFTDLLNVAREAREPKSFREALTSLDAERWRQAMTDELNGLMQNNTWELVDPPRYKTILGCKWVFKLKHNEMGNVTKYKARLVAQGFSQKFGIDYDEVFAPVVRQTTIRMLLTIAGSKNWIVKHFDAKTAFINGELKEDIYMRQPKGNRINIGDEKKVCKLKKSIYGLKQAAKSWNDKLKETLQMYGFMQGEADSCLFAKQENENLILLAVYVDDMLVTGNSRKFIQDTMQTLGKQFDVIDLGEVKHYVGIEVTRDINGIFYLNQRSYIQKLIENTKMENSKPSAIPLDLGYLKLDHGNPLKDNAQYQKLIGALLYIAVNTRLDIMASVCILAQRTINPTQSDWNEAKRVLRYLRGTMDLKLKLGRSGDTEKNGLIGYADADWGQDQRERKSNSGYICEFNGAVISWSCKKQTCVALSSTEAEIIALSEACKEILWIHNRTKHVDTKYHFARDLQSKGIIDVRYCPTEHMLADMLTKPLGGVKLKNFRYRAGLYHWKDSEGDRRTIAVEEE
ncbi:retrovirus-related pol polyprotein from transposon tnt 1-94 [Lasius niger]|uniref:Retrovirus-related pol polyprotein from transposon tnt 1-94 n=1 Tax=Lasius niger TaxID=67767 RepID=A0A0J7K7B7_LASNI|nr:retrovirus-related pol polyprotein from transposon tnt 1-94 [Lasius niger]